MAVAERRTAAASRRRSAPRGSAGNEDGTSRPMGGLIGFGTSPSSTIRFARAAHARDRGPAPPRAARPCTDASAALYSWCRWRELDGLAEVHHQHAVGDVADDVEVVRDEDVGQAEVALQVLEQVQDLRLHRDVERRDGLVADDQLRIDGERAGDADALALAAGELVREAVVVLRVEADDLEQLLDAALDLGRRCRCLCTSSGLGDDEADAACARSATRTDPGRSSSSRGGSGASARERLVMSRPVEDDRGRRWDRAGA